MFRAHVKDVIDVVDDIVDLPQVDSLIFLVMARYIGTIKKKIERAKTPEINRTNRAPKARSNFETRTGRIVRRTLRNSNDIGADDVDVDVVGVDVVDDVDVIGDEDVNVIDVDVIDAVDIVDADINFLSISLEIVELSSTSAPTLYPALPITFNNIITIIIITITITITIPIIIIAIITIKINITSINDNIILYIVLSSAYFSPFCILFYFSFVSLLPNQRRRSPVSVDLIYSLFPVCCVRFLIHGILFVYSIDLRLRCLGRKPVIKVRFTLTVSKREPIKKY